MFDKNQLGNIRRVAAGVKLTEKCRKRACTLKPHYYCWGPNGVSVWVRQGRIGGRAAVVAVLEDLPVICSLVVAAASMIMIGIMLWRDWPL